jgi:uncharacterized protein (UPF0261 family)
MTFVALVGTLDTKGEEYNWLCHALRSHGVEPITVDCGVLGEPEYVPQVSASEVAEAAGLTLDELRTAHDRGAAVTAMGHGAATTVTRLHKSGQLHGVLALGGTGGTSLATQAMRALPVGVPKLMVSTVASGNTAQYVGASDISMMYSVVDIAGINRVSVQILGNAAAGIAGMATAYDQRLSASPEADDRPLVGATMFGVTTPAVDAARTRLAELGYEVLVFHATGSGGLSMEALATAGLLDGVLDLTTTELADDLVGGVFSAGPGRLEAAGRAGVPQVVSVGALDMVNFGPLDSVPSEFTGRKLHVHNPSVTLMRTTREEMAELGRRIAMKLREASAPTAIFIPQRGVSAIDTAGGPFEDPVADAALFNELRVGLSGTSVRVLDMPNHINDPEFARAMADLLDEMIKEKQHGPE